jgi:hypothetical protein
MTKRFFQSVEEPIGSCVDVGVNCELAGRQFAVVDADGSAISLHATKEAAEIEAAAEHTEAGLDGYRSTARVLTLKVD